MPSLVATKSALARTTCVRTHYVRTNFELMENTHRYTITYRWTNTKVTDYIQVDLLIQFGWMD